MQTSQKHTKQLFSTQNLKSSSHNWLRPSPLANYRKLTKTVRGGPFDSWGEAMVFCKKKDCSANNGKKNSLFSYLWEK